MTRAAFTKIIPLGCFSFLACLANSLSTRPSYQAAAARLAPEVEVDPFTEWPVLNLENIIKKPVGPLGCEFTDEVKSLEGRQVRVTGFMVHTDWADRTTALVVSYPANISEREFGPCDDLPPTPLYVKVPALQFKGFQRGVLSLAGTLRLGSAEEPYDHRSFIRLELDPRVENWHVSPKTFSEWTPRERDNYLALSRQQQRISCASCGLMTDPTTTFVSPTTTINTRKSKP